VAAYWRTNLTLRQLAPLLGISKSAADRIVGHLGPALALQPRRRFRKDTVLIVDGTLVPTRDRALAASSKNYRCSTKPPGRHRRRHPPDRRRWEATARQPQRLPGLGGVRAKAAAGTTPTVIANGGYRGTGLTIPHYRRHKDEQLPAWKEEHNTSHRKVRARVEHTFARMKSWKILRDCRLRGDGVHHAILGIARLHNLTLTG
jgi:hypothetical protein